MVNLAPHLVKPLPLLIPAFDGKRPDRKSGVGLNLYDVMSRERRSSRRRGTDLRPGLLEPGAPPHRGRRRDAGDAARAGAARAHLGLPVLRLPDRRHAAGVHGARRGRAVRRGVRQRGRGRGPRRARRPRRRRPVPRRHGRRRVRADRRERGERHRGVGRPDPPRRAARRGRGAADQAQPRHPPDGGAGEAARGLRGDRARGERAVHLRAALAGADADRHHRRDLRARAAGPRSRLRGGRGVPARRGQRVLRHVARPRTT